MNRSLAKTSATVMATAALLAASPEVSSAEKLPTSANICKTANNNKSNRLLRRVVRQVGSRVLNFNPKQAKNASSYFEQGNISLNGSANKSVTLNNGASEVTGSNGEYVMKVSSEDIGSNGKLDIGDVNRLKISLGSASDGGPLFGLSVYHLDKRWTDGPKDENCWYNVNGTAVLNSGERVSFNGTPQTQYANQPEIFLDGEEAAASGLVMRGLINDALNGVPTHLVEPPIKELQ